MTESLIMLAELRQNCTNVEMNLARVRDHQVLGDCAIIVVYKRFILEDKRSLQVLQRISKLVRLAEEARKVVVRDGSHSVVLFGEEFGFLQELLAQFVVLPLQVGHAQNIADDRNLVVHLLQLLRLFTEYLFDQELHFIEFPERLDLLAFLLEGQSLVEELLDLQL